MTTQDAYQDLYQLYSIFNVDSIKDSLMELLRAQFTAAEAELAVKIGFGGGKLKELSETTGIESAKLKNVLETMALKGTVWIDPDVEDPNYKTIGLAGPGLVETGGWGNVKYPHSVSVLHALHKFEKDFATKWLPAVGAPVTRVWLTPAALPDDAKPEENLVEMLKKSGPWGVSTCSCRLPSWVSKPGDHCEFPLEVCLFTSEMTKWGLEQKMCREITYEEVLEILQKCNEEGMVHTHDPNEFVCNCCNDCCVMLMGHYVSGKKVLQHSEFIPRIDDSECSACGECAERCPVDAIIVDAFATVDVDKCLGCGVCFPTCPTEAIKFVRRPEEITFEEHSHV